jgi:hypothetical protein
VIAGTTHTTVQVGIPNDCAMQADVTPDIDLRFHFGEPECGVEVTFERLALERFLHLALDLLATPWPDEEPSISQPAAPSATRVPSRRQTISPTRTTSS